MTLKDLIHAIEITAAEQPCVQEIVQEDIFRLNTLPNRKYGVFAWLQGQHTANVASGMVDYAFTLFYVDRLTHDLSNAIDIQSSGMVAIDNIIRTLDEEGIPADNYTVQPFTQRFVDECAGVFATVSFSVPVGSLCPETFDSEGKYLLTSDGLFVVTSDGKKIQVL